MIGENIERMNDPIWTDEPVSSGEEDALGRVRYAKRAAELIAKVHSPESSAVIGLSGPWGSGKTSLVNMIVEQLHDAHPEWSVSWFTPWATSDIAGLLGEFYSALTSALPKKQTAKVRKALAVTASVAAPALTTIPVAGASVAEAVRLAGGALSKSPSWQTAFARASKELRQLGKPILVVVDDIDRLHGDELLTLLKVIRLLGRFDGVQYLLAYDDETLYRNLSGTGAVDAPGVSPERLMEKIVQYPLFVPEMARYQQLARLDAGFEEVSRELGDNQPSSQRLSGLAHCFTNLLTTPRAIDRYIAQLQHHIPLLPPDEIDDEDLQLLTLLRVALPALYAAIPRYRDEFIRGHINRLDPDVKASFEYIPFSVDPILKHVAEEDRETARELLLSLFPKLPNDGRYTPHGSNRRQSVQHAAYFDRYFVMGILGHDVSDESVQQAVAAAAIGDPAPLTRLMVGKSSDFRGLVIEKGLAPEHQPTSDQGRTKVAEALAIIANELPEEQTSPFSDLDQLLRWMSDLLCLLSSDTAPAEVQTVVRRLDGLTTRIRLCESLADAFLRVNVDETPHWYQELTKILAEEATDRFLSHLQEGDEPKQVFGIGYQLRFALRYSPQELRRGVHELVNEQAIDLATLASRLVTVSTWHGTEVSHRLSDDGVQVLFDQLAPTDDDLWYEEPRCEVDVQDLSWSNRRKLVTGRVRRPTEGSPAPK